MAQVEIGDSARRRFSQFVKRECVEIAMGNWQDWQEVYEHKAKPQDNPVLAKPSRFKRFYMEYSVHRTIRKGRHNDFRKHLAKWIHKVIADDTGHTLDKFEKSCRRRFGTFDGKRKMISVISKVAAFVRPERFIAWDESARAGVNLGLGQAKSAQFESYACYLAGVDRVWEEYAEELIKAEVRKYKPAKPLLMREAFLRRVFDVSLMSCGGREF